MKKRTILAIMIACVITTTGCNGTSGYDETNVEDEQVEMLRGELQKQKEALKKVELLSKTNEKTDNKMATNAKEEISKEYSDLSDNHTKLLAKTLIEQHDEGGVACDLGSSISYGNKTYPIIAGGQEQIEEKLDKWIDVSCDYQKSLNYVINPKVSINDNRGIYLAASSELPFVKELRDKTTKIIYTDIRGKQATYKLAERVKIPQRLVKGEEPDPKEKIYKYLAGDAGNVIAIQVTHDNSDKTEYLVFKPVK